LPSTERKSKLISDVWEVFLSVWMKMRRLFHKTIPAIGYCAYCLVGELPLLQAEPKLYHKDPVYNAHIQNQPEHYFAIRDIPHLLQLYGKTSSKPSYNL